MTCPSCGQAIPGSARFCPECGAGIGSSAPSPTRTLHAMDAGPSSGAGGGARAGSFAAGRAARFSSSSSDSLDHGRFVPGFLLQERYRILGLLGSGGMGEVYRADDLKLGQPVALKFMPVELAQDASRLARFHGEVRLARQVSHPNVCRVYDIGEVDGQAFLSMEYIDGEDLSTLLRRIGRLPQDKAIEIARQLCAGLAAAHDRGVLHRDLKPANVMIDGRGRARITDFGLAGMAGSDDAARTRAGTPAYMSPEQLAQGEATVRSDIYALGLVLYELFTGKRAFQGETFAELQKNRQETEPPSPSSLVDGLDPAVERVILRCLEEDPRQRPPSALAVAAALPGGDPLAMALAAGETPSPEMVAAAGEVGGLRPLLVWACLGTFAAGILCLTLLEGRTTLLGRAAPTKPPDVLADRAREVARRFGYPDPPVGVGQGFGWHRSYMEHIRDTDQSAGRWDRLSAPQPPAIFFWYRESPRHLEAHNVGGRVTTDDPAPLVPGMLEVQLTSSGDLWRFSAVPPQIDEGGTSDPPVDWAPLFAEAALKFEDFKPVEPRWVPSAYGDVRAAWEGTYAGVPQYPVRVEAAAYRGRPVFFHDYWPWNRPLRVQPFEESMGQKSANIIILVMVAAAILTGLLLARRNLSLGRVDRRGAHRLALVIFGAVLVSGLCAATHVPTPQGEWELFVRLCSQALFEGALVWLYYIALEPTVRRRWPDRIISWTRLLGGRVRDPLVGRDILVGTAFGAAMAVLGTVAAAVPAWLGRAPAMPDERALDLLHGPRAWVAFVLFDFAEIVQISMVILFALLLGYLSSRRQWAAAIGLVVVGSVITSLQMAQSVGVLGVPFAVATSVLVMIALTRFGLLALVAALLTLSLLTIFPVLSALTTWYGASGLFVLVVLASLALFSARTALAGRSLLELRLLED
ncbi:MAG TPA: serine/threonine-protein kinase [Candidatus Cryosericum sp.]|nr:serine/threonine-protein kinase [Candidatus Cryosericum sp.]